MVEFVAEFTTNHMGNLNLLLKMVEAAKESGADWIKMQRKDVDTFYTKEKLDKPYDSPYGKTYGDYRRMFEFSYEQMHLFNAKCMELDIPWFSTVQDIKSLQWYEAHFDLPRYKISSSKAHDWKFLDAFMSELPVEKEVVISTAGLDLKQIDNIIHWFRVYKNLYILHCVAEYPCPEEHTYIGNIKEIRKLTDKYDNVHVGYSGHEEGVMPSVLAINSGADMVERHFCLSRKSFVHHIDCSLEPNEFKYLVDANRKKFAMCFDIAQVDKILTTNFGMTEMERSFLVDQTYGDDYLGKESKI